LCAHLVARKNAALAADAREALATIGYEYERSWRRNFAARVHAAALFAHLGMRPAAAKMVVALLKQAPTILTLGAHWSGKTHSLRSPLNVEAV
jgi:menaquinone-9 beta-reductase